MKTYIVLEAGSLSKLELMIQEQENSYTVQGDIHSVYYNSEYVQYYCLMALK